MNPLEPTAGSIFTLSSENPWPDLAAFGEDGKSFFKGRERETAELARLVKRESLSVCFGKSGTGKTSLLRAGLFPALREENYVPIYIRLNYDESTSPLVDQVKAELTMEIRLDKIDALDPTPDEPLWSYFHRKDVDWWDQHDQLITPVLVFDQFEEILTLGYETPCRSQRVEDFLAELEDLIEKRVPERIRRRFKEDPTLSDNYDFGKEDFRVVLSLREDFLPELESLRERLRPIMLNRFRLLPMNGDQAFEVITGPAPGLVDDETAIEIIQRVSLSERSQLQALPSREQLKRRQVEPALLSVFCSELNRRRLSQNKEKIDRSVVEEAREEILTGFYERALEGCPEEVREFVEDRLLTVTGARDRYALENALTEKGIDQNILSTLINRRLLRKEVADKKTWLELTHDTIADVARASKRAREERKRTEAATQEAAKKIKAAEATAAESKKKAEERARQRTRALVFGALCFLLAVISLGLAGWVYFSNREIKDLQGTKNRLESEAAVLKAKKSQLEAQYAALGDEDNRLGIELTERERDTRELANKLASQQIQSSGLMAQIEEMEKFTHDAFERVGQQLERFQNIAFLSLEDIRTQDHPLLTKDQVTILQNAFDAIGSFHIYSLPGVITESIPSNLQENLEVKILKARADTILAVLDNDLDAALERCEAALTLIQSTEKTSADLRWDMERLHGDILAHQAALLADSNAEEAQQKWKQAQHDYDELLQLGEQDPLRLIKAEMSLGDVARRVSLHSHKDADIVSYRQQALDRLNSALRRLEQLPPEQKSRADALSLLSGIYRKIGNVYYDYHDEILQNSSSETDKADCELLDKIIKNYRIAQEKATQAEKSLPATGVERETLMVDEVFTEANLADCLSRQLSFQKLNYSERARIVSDLRMALDARNELCLRVFASDRSNFYYASLLCTGLRKYADFAIRHPELQISREIASDKLRLAILLTGAVPTADADGLAELTDRVMGSDVGKRMRDTLRVINDFNRKLAEIEGSPDGFARTRGVIAAPNQATSHEESEPGTPH
jgi:hypothetical protein